jgi:hypothetical protein
MVTDGTHYLSLALRTDPVRQPDSPRELQMI